MPVAYEPKPIKLTNIKTINKIGLNISNLSRSQSNGLDSFISLIKKANKRSDLREEVADQIFEFAEALKGLKAPQVRDILRSVRTQIAKGGKYSQEPKRYLFELSPDLIDYLHSN